MTDTTIVSAAIYPPIGICRVGNSPDDIYIGPETPNPGHATPGFYRDSAGRLKREAARFRVYGLNAAGEAVAELNATNATIDWTVQVANHKSAWYNFEMALDIPESAMAKPSTKRNATITDRASLMITPSAKSISGMNAPAQAFDDGYFQDTQVYLGELRTDEAGRLVVLGGHGVSGSIDNKPATTFANNDGWYDDICDGPVTASVTYGGTALPVAGAWVVSAPPNYGTQLKSVRTMWDVMRDTAVTDTMLAPPSETSFQTEIRPIFERLTRLEWVNQGFLAGFGYTSAFDFTSQDWLIQLNDNSAANAETRRVLANNFRNFHRDGGSPVPWPWLYGDAMSGQLSASSATNPRQNAALSDLQLRMLAKWASGDFVPDCDFTPPTVPAPTLDSYPVAEQPDLLTQAAMEFCLADAFHPGCEMTWPVRNSGMFEAAFRFKTRPTPEPDYGPVLTPAIAMSARGPVNGGQLAGSISRWMAVPWQTDTASCRSGYDRIYDPYLPTFWPARVPNQVMSETDYEFIKDTSNPLEERQSRFALRADWLEPLDPTKSQQYQINHMIHHFDQMGIVEQRPGLPGDPDFPDTMMVSDQPDPIAGLMAKADRPIWAQSKEAAELADNGTSDPDRTDKANRFGKTYTG